VIFPELSKIVWHSLSFTGSKILEEIKVRGFIFGFDPIFDIKNGIIKKEMELLKIESSALNFNKSWLLFKAECSERISIYFFCSKLTNIFLYL